MSIQRSLAFLALLAALSTGAPLLAKEGASGTLTHKGKTTALTQVYVDQQSDPDEEDAEFLVVLVSDRALAAAEREPARLLELAQSGKVAALRYVWKLGTDWSAITPYLAAEPLSGRRVPERPTLEIDALDDQRVTARVHSKKLGQDLHFSVRFEAAINPGGTLDLEPVAVAEETATGASVGGDPRSQKRALGQFGYVADAEGFARAVMDGHAGAVELFLKLGHSADLIDSLNTPLVVVAARSCVYDPKDQRTPVMKLLLAAKAKPNATDENGSTALIWAAESCDAEAVSALIAAGANVNAKAKGGATPLMMATVFNRAEIVEILKKAGAK